MTGWMFIGRECLCVALRAAPAQSAYGRGALLSRRVLAPAGPFFSSRPLSAGEREYGSRGKWMRWFGIPASLGIACLAALQLMRTIRREHRQAGSRAAEEPTTWQLSLFRLLPARLLSRTWGHVMALELPYWLRRPVLGLYVWTFSCKMEEAVVQELGKYGSLMELFTRELKKGARTVSHEHPLVCPADGKVLHFGKVQNRRVEQVKGVTYSLDKFLGPGTLQQQTIDTHTQPPPPPPVPSQVLEIENADKPLDSPEKDLYHVIIYLAPGDCHHFHSPTDWKAHRRRHFPGELLTVAPWAARTMPGLFALNERAVLSGHWKHGFFSLTAVGAYNVGSIQLTVDKELRTNQKGRYQMGQFSDKQLGSKEAALGLSKGDRLGCFSMGSSIVLVFEAPRDFEFVVEPGQRVLCGQPLGVVGTWQKAGE